jgi:hypothetical protein
LARIRRPARKLWLAGAALFGEEADQRVHGVVARRVDHRAAVAAHGHKTGLAQPVEMKREGVGRQAERRRDLARRKAVRSRLDQQPVGVEPIFLREGRKGIDDGGLFHISRIIEMSCGLSSDISMNVEIMSCPSDQQPGGF